MAKTEEVKGYPYTKPRMPIAAQFANPGPIYGAPPLIGEKDHDFRSVHVKAPSYSFGLKSDIFTNSRSPGPAAYGPDTKLTRHGMHTVPKYSIGQILNPYIKEVTPGPSDYDTSKANNVLWTKAPEYLIGKYLTESTFNITPGMILSHYVVL